MSDVTLNTDEKVTLIGALCDELRWSWSRGWRRAEHLQRAQRLVELCESLPDDGDAA